MEPGEAPPRGRHSLRARREAEIPGCHGRPDDRLRHLADGLPQPRQRPPPRHVRPGDRRGRGQRGGDSRPAAGGHSRPEGGPLRPRRRQGRQGGAADAHAGPRPRRPLAGHEGARRGRSGHRRRAAEGPSRGGGEGRALRRRREVRAAPMSRFFLSRPVFAWVIAIAMMLAGALAIVKLPISQYPPIAPPSISISAVYPGASAKTVEDSVVQIIEQKMTGLDRMLYMDSTSDSSGSAAITLTFAPGTDPDIAWAKVQNKLQLAMPALPDVVQQTGVTVSKSTRNYLLIAGVVSEDGSMDNADLNDYTVSKIESVIGRVPAVGEVQVFGTASSMRGWLDQDKLTKYSMTSDDVVAALRAYNVEVSAGQLGGAPAVPGQRLNASILVQSLLKTPEEFASVPLRTNPDGSVVKVKDVGRTELGTEIPDLKFRFNGKPAGVFAVRQEAGANALETADRIKAKMAELSRFFPPGMKAIFVYDTTPFVKVAIDEVFKTLLEAIFLVFLVFLVMYLFLGNFRATLIPTVAVPVVLLGTFGVLGFLGYSINMLTMFGMVLAIGLLVDDAIVVVENVERIMSEEGLAPMPATQKSVSY